jgi:hypothetical protein
MAWAKAPFAIGSVACAACLAVTATMASAPLAQQAGEQIAKTIHRGATLAANPITQLDAFSALAPGTTLADIDGFSTLGATSISDIDGFSTLGATSISDIDGFSSLGATSITDIDGFSSLGATKLSDIDAFSALPNLANFFTHGDLSRATGLSGIDAFSALPVYNALAHGDLGALAADTTDPDNPVGGIDAFSAVPGFFGIDPTVPAPDIPYTAPMMVAKEAPAVESSKIAAPTGGSNPFKSLAANLPDLPKPPAFVPPAPADAPAATTATTAKNHNKQGDGNVGFFKPGTMVGNPLLLGSGGAVDNSMGFYKKALNNLGIGKSDSTGSESKGADASDSGGTGK